jgi:hypothetical protein
MECLWRLFRHWQQNGYRHQQDQTVLYVHFSSYNGFSYYYLYGAGFLAQYAEVYLGSEAESVVLFVIISELLFW